MTTTWLFQLSIVTIASILTYHVANVEAQYPARSNNTELVYALRNIKYFSKPIEAKLVSDACVRSLAVQKLMGLKLFIKILKSEDKEPSDDTIQKLQTLRKISFTSNFSLIADLPDVKQMLHDINANINRLYESSNQQLHVNQNPEDAKDDSNDMQKTLKAIDETPEQRQTRAEQNEQLKQSLIDENTKVLTQVDDSHEEQSPTEESGKITTETNDEIPISTAVLCLKSLFGEEQNFSSLLSKPEQALDVPNSMESFKAREELLILIHRANAKTQLESLFDLVNH